MKISLNIMLDGMHFRDSVAMDVPELLSQHWQPIDVCDDPMMSCISGPSAVNEDQFKVVMKMREGAASILADSMAKLIVESMKQKDTSNGYSKEKTY